MMEQAKKLPIRKWEIIGQVLLRWCTNPVILILTGVSWIQLYTLCMYGGVARRLPVLAVCLLLWFIGVIAGIPTMIFYIKRSPLTEIEKLLIEGERFISSELTFETREVRRISKTKKGCWVFLRGHRLIYIFTEGMEAREKEYLWKRLIGSGFFRNTFWKKPVLLLMLLITFMGSIGVVHSGMHLNGKLAWMLRDLRDKRSIVLSEEEGNLYQNGIRGVLEAVEKKVELPPKLCLANSFNLHFAPDGTILSLNTMWYGFTDTGEYVNSYLISYNCKTSDSIRVDLNGMAGAIYDGDKDVGQLIEALDVIDYEALVDLWQEEEYGILYYGVRTWAAGEKNVYRIDAKGNAKATAMGAEKEGYSISVFCPGEESAMVARFLYAGEETLIPDVNWVLGMETDTDQMDQSNQLEQLNQEDRTYQETPCYEDAKTIEELGALYHEIKNYQARNGDYIYCYQLDKLYLSEDYPDADVMNKALKNIYSTNRDIYEKHGRSYKNNETAQDYSEYENYPSDRLYYNGCSYEDEQYFNFEFLDYCYTGGEHGFPTLLSYVIDRKSGELVSIFELTGWKEETICEKIKEVYELYASWQTPNSLVDSTNAGTIWLDHYRQGENNSGYSLGPDGIYLYYGNGVIAEPSKGFPTIFIPWTR